MVKLQSYKGKYFLTVPKDKIRRGDLKAGDEFDVDATSGSIVFVKLRKEN
ncbi:hypothetical protein HYT57_01965 [Candidatus Woesearchaeota archaeon]|nr:hypothetical protein [Candidatus Woesearchaeota archaeon]